jgi:phospholipid/cholesterol/gamma-HCH transport system substrate-binding protein
MPRSRMTSLTATALAVLLLAATAFLVHANVFRPTTITAIFTTATSIYPGDEVRISGVKVGTISTIRPNGAHADVVIDVDHGVAVPADAKAIIVAQNLVSARFVQLAPAYESGPRMASGATIPVDRTAVPVEWDEVKKQLTRLATDVGPASDVSGSSIGRFIDSAANAMDGNGEKLRQTLAQLSGAAGILASHSGNFVDTIKNLQVFVGMLRQSNEQIVQFQNRLATLSSVVDGARSDLDGALTNLSQAVDEVTRFVKDTRDGTSEQVHRLANVTQNLVDHRMDLEQVLHIAPNAIANSYNMFDPRTGGASGVFVLNNFSDPTQFLCGMMGSIGNVTAPETAKLCTQTLGPGLSKLNFNYLPFPLNPLLTSVPSAGKLIYTDPKLAPGGSDDDSPPAPPAVSAYAGAPGDAPAPPPPAGTAEEPGPAPATLPDLLLPTGEAPS